MKKTLGLLTVLFLASCGGTSDVGRYQLHSSSDDSLLYLVDTATGLTDYRTSGRWSVYVEPKGEGRESMEDDRT